jgi:hypothetical protein
MFSYQGERHGCYIRSPLMQYISKPPDLIYHIVMNGRAKHRTKRKLYPYIIFFYSYISAAILVRQLINLFSAMGDFICSKSWGGVEYLSPTAK